MAHSGNPLEGDSLKFVWKSYGCSLSGSYDGTTYYMEVIYSIEYLTDFEQETALTAAIENLKEELALEGLSDYEIVKAIYDYMTDNITYDYANLNDASYELKYTAYAALINKTAVCQGYAVLFYRLALEYGIDARVITGTSFGEAHAWNIVQLGDYYYDLDATWDAGSSKYNYFLKCEANFPDHTRNTEYLTAEFNAKYVMDDEDYKQNQSAADTMIETTDFTFVIKNGKATLTKYKGSAQEVVIPGKVENYLVTKLGNLSFCDNDTIRKVTIPNSVESIESASEILVDGAFYHCDNLTEVVFEGGSKITDLGECTFMDAKSLEKIEIPSSVKALKLSLFENCESLKELELPEGLEVLHQNALSSTGITKLHLPSTLISYHEWTFMPYLEEITVAEGSQLFRSASRICHCQYIYDFL